MKVLFLSLLCFLISSCTTKTIAPDSLNQDLMFPYGVYEHKITIQSANPTVNGQSFRGVVSLSATKIEVVALSFFGTTVFKISENVITSEINVEIYIEKLKKMEPKLRQQYQLLRVFLTAPKSGMWDKRLEVLERHSDQKPKRIKAMDQDMSSEFTVLSYDKNEIPEKVISESKDVSVTVYIVGYELRP